MSGALKAARVILFAPGDRPERFAKATAARADGVTLDLEDGVGLADKDRARDAVMDFLAAPRAAGPAVGVRVNRIHTQAGARDLVALIDAARPDFIIAPKVESAFEIDLLHRHFASTPIIAVIESAKGLGAAPAIAAAPGIAALAFGSADLAADLRASFAWEPLLYARSRVIAAAAEAGVEAIDAPHLALDGDSAALEEECVRARALGFVGKFAIHPKHVAAIRRCFSPQDADVAQAEALIAAAEASRGGAFEFNGRMVDEPVLRVARRALALRRADLESGAAT